MRNLLSSNNKVFALFIFAFLVRLAVGLYSYEHKKFNDFSDDNARNNFAQSIIEKGLAPDVNDYYTPESIFAPVVPLILVIKNWLFGNSWLPIFILNALIGALASLMIFHIARFYFSYKISLISFLWAALYPSYIRYTGTSGNEPLIVLLFAMTIFFAIKSIQTDKFKSEIIFYSLSFILLIHTDERYISYAILFTLFLFIGKYSIQLKLKKALIFILFSFIFSMPWMIRNYIYYDDIVLISIRTTGLTNPILHHRKDLMIFDHTPQNKYLNPTQIDSVKSDLLKYFPDGQPISQQQIQDMKLGNIPHEFSFSEKIISRAYMLWLPMKFNGNYRITGYNHMNPWSIKHNVLMGLSYGVLLPFVLITFIFMFWKRKWTPILLFGGMIIYHTLIHVAFIPYTRDRYRHPIDFIIIILGVYGLYLICNYFTKNKKKTNNKMEKLN
jgi:hypothetical protein